MLQQVNGVKSHGRQFSAPQQARALGIILGEEFDTPFTFYDAATGAACLGAGANGSGLYDKAVPIAPEAVLEAAADGRARVTRLADGSYQLLLVLYQGGKPVLIGAGRVTALVPGGPSANVEQARLQKWLQAVSDRLRLADQSPRRRQEEDGESGSRTAWDTVLTLDHLIRKLRLHKETNKNQRRILEAAFGLLGAQTLIWAPENAESPVVIHGEPCLAPADCQHLASLLARIPDQQEGAPLLCNEVQATTWGGRFPSLVNLLALRVIDRNTGGWVVALNKKVQRDGPASAEFRRSDAAVLTPFVALLEMYVRGSDRYQELKELLVGLTRSLTAALDAKDSYTCGHSERVARIAVELGREMGMGEEELGDLYLAGLLHDVGKIGVRDSILCKAGPLTPEEFEHVKQHVTIGYSILADLRQIRNLLPVVLYHHERYDGGGYPDGLAGEAIPLLARILAVADSYDAMSTTRPYREAMPCRRVEEILSRGANTQWDARVVEAFHRCRHKVHAIRQRGVGDSLRMAIDGALRSAPLTSP